MDEAKRNIQRHYLLVGVTEELEDFIQILELILPRFFKGGHDIFLHSMEETILKKKIQIRNIFQS